MAVNDINKFRQTYNLEDRLLVEADYDNIIIIDPNKVVNSEKKIQERNIQQENLVMYANLETKIIPRTKLAVGDNFDTPVNNTTIASVSEVNPKGDVPLNFLKPFGKNSFDTSWSDDYTGKGSRNGKGINQKGTYEIKSDGNTIFKQKFLNYEDTQNLGITDINVNVTPIGVPTVDMTLIDVRGRTLFEQGEESIYSVFFNLPYPAFYLTLKGYYGKAIRYQLTLTSFNAKFEPSNGNFVITLKFMGRNSALLADSLVSFARHAPKMFTTDVTTQKNTNNSTGTGNDKTPLKVQKDSVGLQKLREVYSIYKSKNLIDQNVPELTIDQFIYRANNFETLIKERSEKGDFSVINDINDYQKTLNDIKRELYIDVLNLYLDLSEILIYDDVIHYPYLESLDYEKRKKIEDELKANLEEKIKKLKNNTSFGVGGGYYIFNKDTKEKKLQSGEISVNLTIDDIIKTINFYDTKINFVKTFETIYGRTPTIEEVRKYKSEFTLLNSSTQKKDINGEIVDSNPTFYTYGEIPGTVSQVKESSFLYKLNEINKNLEDKRKIIEDSLTNELSNLLVNDEVGIGFTPTIRNVFGILFAGLDTFYRLMEDVHTKAWSVRNLPIRLNSVLSPEKSGGVDSTIDIVSGSQNVNVENTVYPWPQYYEKENQKDGSEVYTIKYPGENTSVGSTKGYLNSVWPEVEFTEEYIRASLQTNIPEVPKSAGNEKKDTNLMMISSIEFPFNTLPYKELGDVKFLYEILERAYVASHYLNINRGDYKSQQIDKIISNMDAENVITTLYNTPSSRINKFLKEIQPSFNDFLLKLKDISSGGAGSSWQNFINSTYNTTYINNYFDKTQNTVYSIDTIGADSIKINGKVDSDKILNFINKSKPEFFLDPFLFTNIEWVKNNVSKGNSIDSVEDFYSNSFNEFLPDKKIIFTKFIYTNTYNDNALSVYLKNPNDYEKIKTKESLKSFYNYGGNGDDKLDRSLTESFINYGNNYNGQLGVKKQKTSLLNTPYFINALQKGVDLQRGGNDKNPYTSLGYIFLNSLPLKTLKEQLTYDFNGSIVENAGCMGPMLCKYSSTHKLPYSWILKYGSIWYRYKKYIKEGVDILDDVWTDFNYSTNYDPIFSSTTTTYDYNNDKIILQNSATLINNNITYNVDTLGLGFYPKVINDVHYFLYNKNLHDFDGFNNNFMKDATLNGIKVVNTYNKFFNVNFDVNNLNRTLTIKNYSQYFDNLIADTENYLVVPSMGPLEFNQSEYECIGDDGLLKKEMFNNTSVFNGSVRCLWGVSNFGYFDNTLIKKPKFNEYIKIINTQDSYKNNYPFNLEDSTTTYSSIEEIFAVFNADTLDEFEKLFLAFCNPSPSGSDLILQGELTNSTYSTQGKIKEVKNKKLHEILKGLFLIPKEIVSLTNDGMNDVDSLGLFQLRIFYSKINDFLKFDCILNMGNPSNFDRKIFNYFTNNDEFKPTGGVDITPYVYGTLPGDGILTGVGSLAISQANNKTEWETLKLYVGDFSLNNVNYTDTGSTITDFFIDNNIEFSETNIKKLYPIIKLYVKEKLKDPTLNKQKFNTLIYTFISNQQLFFSDIIENTISYLNNNLISSDTNILKVDSELAGNVSKLEHYSVLKIMNDKWVSGSDFLNRTIFEDFLFLDRANRDIGNEFTIPINKIEQYLNNPNKNFYTLIGNIIDENNFLFFAMPSYINFYGIQDAQVTNKPIPVEIPNSLFGTYLDVDYLESRPKFVCVYVGKRSEFPASDSSFVKYGNDAFDITKPDCPLASSYTEKTDYSKINKVVGFSVDYGTQNQNIFKSVSLDMSEKKTTAESIKMNVDLVQGVNADKVAQQTTSLYSVYRSRSYTCTVDCMGDAMIQPTMYFNLRHVPLFYGPYWIMEVNHKISPGKFDTSFKGIRMPKYSLPKPNSFIESVNKSYIQYYKDLIINTKKIQEQPTLITTSNYVGNVSQGALNGNVNVCFSATSYNKIPFVEIITTHLSETEIKTKINDSGVDEYLKPLYYGIIQTNLLNYQNEDIWSAPNNNFYNISSQNTYSEDKISTIKKQFCATTALQNEEVPFPFFGFESFEENLLFYDGLVKSYLPEIKKLKDDALYTTDAENYAHGYTLFTLFWNQSRYLNIDGGISYYTELPKKYEDFKLRYEQKIILGTKDYDDYLYYNDIYVKAYETFFPY